MAATARAEAEAVARHRSRISPPTGAHNTVPAAEAIATEVVPLVRTPAVTPAKISPQVQKRAKPARPPVERPTPAQPAHDAVTSDDEPTPMVSLDELNEVLARADASKRIFASVDEAAPEPALVAPPRAAMARREPGSRKATVVTIENLSVEGSLTSKVVSRGVQRLLTQYDRCREHSDDVPRRVKLSATIDEAGHGRRVTVEDLSRPSLRHCLEQATAHLVVPAPDTGTARAHWTVRFAAR